MWQLVGVSQFLYMILSLFIVNFFWTKRQHFRLAWQMPGPSLLDVIVEFSKLFWKIPGNLFFDFLHKTAATYKMPFSYWGGSTLYVIIIDPEDIKTVLNSPHCLNRVRHYDALKCFAENGLLTLQTPVWNFHRKLLNPTLNLKKIQTFVPIFNEKAKVLISCLEDLSKKKESTDICIYTKALVLDTIFYTTTNHELDMLKDVKNGDSEMIKKSNKIAAICGARIFIPIYHWDAIYRLTSLYRKEKECTGPVLEILKKVLEEKKATWKVKSEKEPRILIEHLMNFVAEKKFNEKELIGEAASIISAAFETVGITSAYAILMLAMFPNYQEKILEEINSIIPNTNDDVNYEDLNQFDFLDRFIKETLRLFPTIPLIGRRVAETIELGKYRIPAGVNIACPVLLLHRNKDIWGPTAEEFNPDHFLPENLENVHPYAFLPFSGGPRMCFGFRYAKVLLKVILIHCVRNFNFHTDLKMEDLKFKIDISLNLKNKHMVYVDKRDDI